MPLGRKDQPETLRAPERPDMTPTHRDCYAANPLRARRCHRSTEDGTT